MATKKSSKRKPSEYNSLFKGIYAKHLRSVPKKKVTKEVYDNKELQKAFKNAAKETSALVKAKNKK